MCGSSGTVVKSLTVESIANLERSSLQKEIMSACMNEECEIVYFSSTFYPLIFEREIKTEIAYKSGSKNKYICYCHKITKSDIVDSILKGKKRTVKEIIYPHGDIIFNECEKKHPLGCSCVKDIRVIIDEILKENNCI